MPRKTLALISGLVIVTIVLFAIALKSNQQKITPPASTNKLPPPIVNSPAPTSPAHSILSLSPNPVNVLPGQQGKVDVLIDPSDNPVTAVQLELAYDTTVVSNVKVEAGQLIQNPGLNVNFNKDSGTDGHVTYMLGISPNQPTVTSSGVIATITFTAKSSALGKQMPLTLLPDSKITARGVRDSVLKSASSTTVIVGQAGAGVSNQNTSTPYNTAPTR